MVSRRVRCAVAGGAVGAPQTSLLPRTLGIAPTSCFRRRPGTGDRFSDVWAAPPAGLARCQHLRRIGARNILARDTKKRCGAHRPASPSSSCSSPTETLLPSFLFFFFFFFFFFFSSRWSAMSSRRSPSSATARVLHSAQGGEQATIQMIRSARGVLQGRDASVSRGLEEPSPPGTRTTHRSARWRGGTREHNDYKDGWKMLAVQPRRPVVLRLRLPGRHRRDRVDGEAGRPL